MFLHQPVVQPEPKRIISLVPSITELLSYLGLDKETIGITSFCVNPDHWYRQKKRIGGTKTLHVEEIISLQPDLVIANKEENKKEQVEQLAQHLPVWLTDVHSPETCITMIRDMGELTGRRDQASNLISEIQKKIMSIPPFQEKKSAVYLIWKDPYMSVGGDTYISSLLPFAGLSNVLGERTRYPEISVEDLAQSGCQIVLLSSEPYPFKESHARELAEKLVNIPVRLVDGEMFSWYGSRLLHSLDYLQELGKSIRQISH